MKIALLLCCALFAVSAIYFVGRQAGQTACEVAHQQKLLEQIEAGQRLEEERRRLAVERDQLARQLEEEANADPVIVERCLSPDRVRRLNALR